MSDEQEPEGIEPEPEPEGGQAQGASREAARWRRRLREVESERDALAGRLAAMHRAEVERLAADHLSDPADLVDLGKVEVDVLLTEDGSAVDTSKVEQAVADLLARRPYLARDYVPEVTGFDGGADRGASPRPSATWGSLLTGGVRRG